MTTHIDVTLTHGHRSDLAWINIDTLAQRLNVKVSHLRELVARRAIPFARVGRLVRFHWPSVEGWMLAGGGYVAANPEAPRHDKISESESTAQASA